jgi:UPF0755 protein
MRFLISLISGFFALALVGSIATTVWVTKTYKDPGPLSEAYSFEVPKGAGVITVARDLEQQNVIRNALIFRLIAKYNKIENNMKPGEYEIPAHASMAFVMNKIMSGDVVVRRVTLREGLTSWQVQKMLNETAGLKGDAPLAKEGTLMPDTYHFMKDEERSQIIAQMEKAMKEYSESQWESRSEGLPFETLEEALVLASIVEKEAGNVDEMPRIAGVFVNRLRIGMALQTDPTVIYAITNGEMQDGGQGPLGRRLLTKDLQHPSPYNTYVHKGLPPGPIANPGRAAIKATLHPEKNDYIFFVADGTGGHAFGKTLDEHNRNVAQWRKTRAAKEAQSKSENATKAKEAAEAESGVKDEAINLETDPATKPVTEEVVGPSEDPAKSRDEALIDAPSSMTEPHDEESEALEGAGNDPSDQAKESQDEAPTKNDAVSAP